MGYVDIKHLALTYKSCQFVSNISVHAIPEATQLIAIISPREGHLCAAPPDADARTSLGDPCANPKVKLLMLKGCNAQQGEQV